MVVCSVLGCNNSPKRKDSAQKIRFHYFPKDAKLCQMWIKACGNKNKYSLKNSRVCSEHFIESDYRLQDILINVPEDKRLLKIGAVPSQKLPFECELSTRDKRQQVRDNKQIVKECLAAFEKSQKLSTINPVPKSYKKIVKPSTIDAIPETQREVGCIDQDCSYYTNGSTQTEVEYNCSKELRIMELEKEAKMLKKALKRKNQQAQKDETLRTSIRGVFTPSQIKQLEHPSKKPRWSAEDMSSAMSLYSASPRAYRLLRKRNFPFPGPSTLRRWAGQKRQTDATQQLSDHSYFERRKEHEDEDHYNNNNQLAAKVISKILALKADPESGDDDEEDFETQTEEEIWRVKEDAIEYLPHSIHY